GPGISSPSPRLHPLADERNELELLPLATRCLARLGLQARVAIEVASPPPPLSALRSRAFFDLPVLERLREGRVEDRLLDLEGAHSASSRDFTTRSSLPRSSITFTAISREPPSLNGALTVPERCSHTDSSNSVFNAFCRLSQALVRGKNACET